jgi:uncharacterized protein YndB with AHSA1/START domain
MLISSIVILIVIIAAVLLYVARQPNSFRIERTITIEAPPEKIFPLIEDFHQWTHWSPWENIDPQLQRSYAGAERGQGAIYTWRGNNSIGEGRMEIIDAQVPSRIVLKLDFMKPFAAHNEVEFLLEAQDGLTRVTQAMYGPSPLLSKLMGLVFSMDKMVGDKYEQGLASLKALVEEQR